MCVFIFYFCTFIFELYFLCFSFHHFSFMFLFVVFVLCCLFSLLYFVFVFVCFEFILFIYSLFFYFHGQDYGVYGLNKSKDLSTFWGKAYHVAGHDNSGKPLLVCLHPFSSSKAAVIHKLWQENLSAKAWSYSNFYQKCMQIVRKPDKTSSQPTFVTKNL